LFFDGHLITELTIKFRHAYLQVHHPVDTIISYNQFIQLSSGTVLIRRKVRGFQII